MRQSGKKTRVRLKAKPFIVIAIVLNLYLGLTRSPLTSIRHVQVDGARDFDFARIDGDLQPIRGIPCLQVNSKEVETRILQNPEVRNASLSRNIFGSGHLNVAYRTPVAIFAKSKRLALSDEGVIYAANHLDPGLPILQAPRTALEPNLTLAESWEPQGVAIIAKIARNIDVKKQVRILITESGQVILYIGQGRVVLGNCENLDQKFQVLRARLSEKSEFLSHVAQLDLTLPDRPMITPKAKERAP